MKRFALFAGLNYYPGGGMSDFVGCFETEDAAREHYCNDQSASDWYEIVDLVEVMERAENDPPQMRP